MLNTFIRRSVFVLSLRYLLLRGRKKSFTHKKQKNKDRDARDTFFLFFPQQDIEGKKKKKKKKIKNEQTHTHTHTHTNKALLLLER